MQLNLPPTGARREGTQSFSQTCPTRMEEPPDACGNSSPLVSEIVEARWSRQGCGVGNLLFEVQLATLTQSPIFTHVARPSDGNAAIPQTQEQRHNSSNDESVAGNPGVRPACANCQRPQRCGNCEANPSIARRNAKADQLPLLTVLFNYHLQARRSKQTAADLQIPVIKASTTMDNRTTRLE